MPEIPPQQDDPIVGRPMSLFVLVSIFVLLLTVRWSFYSEFFGLRPWRDYQNKFRDVYSEYLDTQIKTRKSAEQAIYTTPDYKKLKDAVTNAAQAALSTDRQIQAQVDLLDRQSPPQTPSF